MLSDADEQADPNRSRSNTCWRGKVCRGVKRVFDPREEGRRVVLVKGKTDVGHKVD